MPNKGDVQVVPHQGRWQAELEERPGPPQPTNTQAAAREEAREIARRNKAELVIHGRNGQVRERTTYGHDPRSKG